MAKWVYSFGAGKNEGSAELRNLLGGKGANLAEMASIGLPVPPGFTITTELCTEFYKNDRRYPDDLDAQVEAALALIEQAVDRSFGDPKKPLLVSVRSGARVSMPGMMDTVLNLGLNDETVLGLAEISGDQRFAWDSFRRFIQMFGSVVLGVDHHRFEEIIETVKIDTGAIEDTQLSPQDWQRVVEEYKDLVLEETGKPFPMSPKDQLWAAIGAVFGSWMNPRANTYRRLHDIPANWGTAVNVQAMVFGNMGTDCATGVCFTRDPSTGENMFYGEFLVRGCGGGYPHAAAAVESGCQIRRGFHGGCAAGCLCRSVPRARDVGAALPRHAGYRVHRAAKQAVYAADAHRQAHGGGEFAHRRGDGRGRADHPAGSGDAGERAGARPTSASHARSQGAAHAAEQGFAGEPRCGQWRRGVFRR
jgi:hypothetical protein